MENPTYVNDEGRLVNTGRLQSPRTGFNSESENEFFDGGTDKMTASSPPHQQRLDDFTPFKPNPTNNLFQSLKDTTSDDVNLKRNVGLLGSISLIVGTMIGSGIFVSPGGVLQNTEDVWFSLVIWVAAGILCMFGGITYIELAYVIPSSGAEYSYILSTFGSIPGFLTSWASLMLIRPAQTAVICLAFGQYFVDAFVDASTVPWAVKLFTVLAILTLTFLNCMSTKLASQIQIFFTIAKLLAVVVIIGGGVYNLSIGKVEHLQEPFQSINWNFGNIASAFYSALWSYDGWNGLNTITEEIKDPHKNFPRAIFIGLPLVIICYLLVNISFLTVMTPLEVSEIDSVGIIYGDRVLGVMSWIIPLAVCMSTFGAANGTLISSSRVSYCAGREGHLPDLVSYVNVHRNTPVLSLILNTLVSVFLSVALDINGLIDFFSFSAWIFYGMTALSMIVLRFTRPEVHRPFKCPIFMPVIVIIMSVFLVIAPVALAPQWEYLYATLFILCGLILYIPFVHLKLKFPYMTEITIALQKIFQSVPPEVEDEVLITAKD